MDENEQLLRELKDIIESFKDIGKYTKDLQAAMAATIRPVQQMSDYMKAVAESSADAQKANSEAMKDVSSMADKLKEMGESLKERNRLTEEEKNVRVQIKQSILDAKQAEAEMKKIQAEDQKIWQEKTKQGELQNKALKEHTGFWREMRDDVEEWYNGLVKAGYELDKTTGRMEKVAGLSAAMQRAGATAVTYGSGALTGQNNPANAIASIGGAIGGLLTPTMGVGGLIGMIIYGVGRDEHFRAVGETASQIFDQVGGHTKKFSAEMAGAARTLSVWGAAAEQDLAQVNAALVSLGVQEKEARAKVDGFSSMAGSSMTSALLAADKAFEMAAGTMASFAATLAKDFNTSMDEAFKSTMNFASAAGQAGFNVKNMMMQSMEAASALRLLNANGETVGATLFGLSGNMVSQGYNQQFSQQYSAQGMSSAAGGIAGMGEGLSAIIGERLGLGSGLDALYAMKSPRGRDSDTQLDIGSIMREMRTIVQDMSPNRSEQAFALTKLFNVDYAGADAILDAMEQTADGQTLSAESQKALNSAFQSEAQKMDQMLKMLDVIKDAIAKVSVGLLMIIVNSLKALLDATIFMGANIAASLPGNDRAKWMNVAKLAGDEIGGDWGAMGKGFDKVGGGLKQLGSAVGVEFGLFAGASGASHQNYGKMADLVMSKEAKKAALQGWKGNAFTAAATVATGGNIPLATMARDAAKALYSLAESADAADSDTSPMSYGQGTEN